LIAAEVPIVEGLTVPTARPAATAALRERARAFIELTKPGITRMVLVTTAAGFYMAAPGPVDWLRLIAVLIGTALVASGAGALNQILERDADARMERTRFRPLPSGRVRVRAAVVFAIAASAIGVVWMMLSVGLLPAAIVAASLLTYLFVYTPLKRRTWLSTVVGAVPGALPILAGWTAGGGAIDAAGLSLFGILFLWQMPHFYALAWLYREDYLRGGFRMLTAYDATGIRTARQAVLYTLVLVPVSAAPTLLGVAGTHYLGGAALLGAAYLTLGLALLIRRERDRARRLFLASVVYLPVLLLLMVLDKGVVS
jgi:protoheme IX farnesyltransferase